jgi:hypothetical protein
VGELDLEAVRVESGEVRDAVLLLEPEHELVADVPHGFEPVELERGGGEL